MPAPVITYRGPGPWGAGYGSDLSALQFDTNNWNIYNSFVELFATSLSKQIAYINEANGSLYVHYTDHSIDGPFLLPTAAFNWRGSWQPTTLYNVNDILQFGTGVYIALTQFTSGSSFSTTDGSGHTWLQLMFTITGVPVVQVTTSTFTPDVSYANTYIRCTNSSGCLITIPPFSDQPFALNSEFQFRDATNIHGGNGLSFLSGIGVALNFPEDRAAASLGIGHTVFFKNIAQDAWDVGGGLASL